MIFAIIRSSVILYDIRELRFLSQAFFSVKYTRKITVIIKYLVLLKRLIQYFNHNNIEWKTKYGILQGYVGISVFSESISLNHGYFGTSSYHGVFPLINFFTMRRRIKKKCKRMYSCSDL